jgi:hypothetical protein
VEQRADGAEMIYDDEEPYGGPDNYDQHMRENERYLFSLHALARVHELMSAKGMNLNDLGHFQHLRYECGISDKQFEHFLTKKEAA